MTPQEFLRQILPTQGYFCLAAKSTGGILHRTYESIDDMVSDASELNTQGKEIYFCVSTLKERSIIVGDKRKIRIGANCAYTRSLILDVDVRQDKPGHHVDNKEALAEIADFSRDLKDRGLAAPTIVFTGGGFHVYWTTDTDVPADEFATKSAFFKTLVLEKYPRLGADPTRIGDRTSLLRIPSLINYKRATEVRVLKIGGVFSYGAIALWQSNNPNPKYSANASTAGFSLVSKSPPVAFDNVAKSCAQIQEMVSNGGSTCAEPLWYAALNLAKHAIDAEQWAHKLSSGHSGYSAEETKAKLDQAISTNTGPTTCRHFSNLRPTACIGCPYFAKITSPIQLSSGVIVATTKATNQITFTPPWPYSRRSTGGIEVAAEEGVPPELVYDYDLFPVKKLRDEFTGDWLVRYRYFQPVDGWREETAPLADFYDKKSASKALMRGGVVSSLGQANKTYSVGRYMVDAIRALEKVQASSVMYGQFGWREDDSGFIVGNRLYTPGAVGEVEMTSALKPLVPKFATAGSLQRWYDVYDVYNKPGLEAFAFGALLAFASPIYKFTGHHGIIFNLVGEKGCGKSTVLKVISSVWMKPEEQLLKESDTINSAEVILGAMRNLPVTYDEITNIDEKKLSDLCYNITQGRGRNRLNADAKLKNNIHTWALVMCASSNLSLVDKLGQYKSNASAEAIRVFEVHITGQPALDKVYADTMFRKLDKNYGIAGDIFMRYIVDNMDEVTTSIEEMMAYIDRDLSIRSPERFWSALVACVMVGGSIAKNLGLHGYDMERLYEWAAKQIQAMRVNVEEKSADPESILGNFLSTKAKNTAVVVRGKVRETLMPHLREAIQIRLEVDPGSAIAFVEYKAITEYCKINSISMSWLESKFKGMKILVETGKTKRLAAGCSDMPAVGVRCWVLNLSGQEFRKDIEAVVKLQETLNAKVQTQDNSAAG